MRFTSASEAELASNMALGGSAELLPANFLSKEEVVILRNAAAATSINIAGIDFLKVGGELFVLEVNNSPGLYTACKLGTEKHLSDIVTAVETLHLQK
jgi:glutathione synthase/RimK-type ligase-like ATP-grasp enzyme